MPRRPLFAAVVLPALVAATFTLPVSPYSYGGTYCPIGINGDVFFLGYEGGTHLPRPFGARC